MSRRPPIARARPGQHVGDVIAAALAAVARPATAYAYFAHNGVIVTVDKTSTAETAEADWRARLGVLCDTAEAASNTPNSRTA